MIQIIGLIVAAYAVARLIQVPAEPLAIRGSEGARTVLAVVSVFGLLVIAALTFALLLSGVDVPQP